MTSDRPVPRASTTRNGIIDNEGHRAGLPGPVTAAGGGPVAAGRPARPRGSSPRRELAGILLLGALGAGLVFLALHQSWAQVRTAVPAPLPASVVRATGQDLIPYGEALAVAALASLAAVLATRRLARRIVGGLLAGLGIGIAAAVSTGATASAALAAAARNISPATGSGAGNTAGSATGGGPAGASAIPNVAGFRSHAVLTATAWQALAVAGAIAIIAAGVLVVWRAPRLPVMSSRYDAPASAGARVTPARRPAGRAESGRADPGRPAGGPGPSASVAGPGSPGAGGEPEEPDSASMWESLSRGEDPTSAGRHG